MSTLNFSINFFIKTYKVNSEGMVTIFAKILINRVKTEISTNKQIKINHWDKKYQRIISHPNAEQENAYLQEFKSRLQNAHSQLFLAKQVITGETIKALVLGEDVVKVHSLIAVTKEHNKHFESLIGTKFSYGSYKNHKTTLSYLKEFVNKYYKRNDISLKNVDYKFCEMFFHFLTTEKPCKNNGAIKHIQRLKKIINFSIKMGYAQSSNIGSFSVKFTPYKRAKLSWEEILKLQKLKVTNPTLKNVLNVFLFQCYTGLSYADVKKINWDNIISGVDDKLWISMIRTKTNQGFSVPLLKPAISILNQYKHANGNYTTPIFPVLCNQKMNSNLKILAEIAKLSTNLTCHVARHAFATTITLQEGVPIETVSKMLGHSSIRTTQIYATVTELKISKDMLQVSRKHNRTRLH